MSAGNPIDLEGAPGLGRLGLDVQGLSYRYGAKTALDDVSFAVAKGRFCALLGLNGAGKSTLFALLTRLFATQSGRIVVDGVPLAERPGAALARMGVVFQQPTLDLDLSVRRNMRYFAALHGLSGGDAERRIQAALERLAMAERIDERVGDLNGGHRRRMEIARALVHEPAVLLLDEPTVGLDARSRADITDHVHGLCGEGGLTVLWATHLVDEVREDDDLAILHRGRLKASGPAPEVMQGAPISEAFARYAGDDAEEAAEALA